MVGTTTGGQLIAALLWLATPEPPPAPAPDPQLLLYLADFADEDAPELDPLEFDEASTELLPALNAEKQHEHENDKKQPAP